MRLPINTNYDMLLRYFKVNTIPEYINILSDLGHFPALFRMKTGT